METKLKRVERYKGFTFKIYKLSSGYYAVKIDKGNKKLIAGSGTQQYAGMGKTRQDAINDAKHTIDNYGSKW